MGVITSAIVGFVATNAAAITATAAAVGAAATVGGTLYSANKANKAQKEQEKAAASQRQAQAAQVKQQELQQARARREAIKSNRLARSATIQAGIATGAGTSSSREQGSTSSLGSQGASNLSFLDTQTGLTDVANRALVDGSIFESRANKYTSSANIGSSIAGLGQTIFSGAGGLDAFTKKATGDK